MARLNLPLCECGALKRDHAGGAGPCEAALSIPAHGDCRCTKFKKAHGRGNKFNARRVAGFDSQAEFERWRELQLLQQGGYVSDVVHHPTVDVAPDGCPEINWKIDFSYTEDGRRIFEEHKGFETEAYIIKRKLFRAKYPDVELRITAKVRGRIVPDRRDRRAA